MWADCIHEPLVDRRLKIGYISSDFCNHPVSRFLLPILKSHNEKNFEIIGLHCGPNQDKVTNLVKAECSQWIDLTGANDIEVARIISDLNIDVIIELGGYTGFSRIKALIYKPAPVQLSYLGYFAPTYLSCIDGWIGDKELFGNLNKIDRRQNLLHIEGGYMAYKPIKLPPLEREDGENVRFGSFNNSRKLGTQAINLFCQVLKGIPNSELVIKSITFVEKEEKDRIRELFQKNGLENNRLIMLDWVEGTESHLTLYKWIDIALDPIPYGGATTTAEALWMGVPVIALAGEGMVGRLSTSLLRSAKCDSWIAHDCLEYQLIAKKLASQGQRDVHSRKILREKINRSPLANGQRVAEQIETYCKIKINELLPS